MKHKLDTCCPRCKLPTLNIYVTTPQQHESELNGVVTCSKCNFSKHVNIILVSGPITTPNMTRSKIEQLHKKVTDMHLELEMHHPVDLSLYFPSTPSYPHPTNQPFYSQHQPIPTTGLNVKRRINNRQPRN